ncbi:UDP-3-O-(3-hydroxymyristoyl)glucosamine N-acyltransferase [Cellvibrio sp.]|uniref:UDP-3-O-(3-hydroxymyristoyl)glucosamine N-acyltransferase n=1 Tax=Cellvibrio sp. TaxID=1965322 RepID=UPI0039647B8B
MAKHTFCFTLAELAQCIGAELVGDPQHPIYALATLQAATVNELSFIANPAYKKYLGSTQAGAVICHPELADSISTNKLIVSNPYLAFARLTPLFDSSLQVETGIHPTAVIGKDCEIGKDVCIQPNVVIADGVRIGDGVFVGAGTYIGADSCVGAGTRVLPNVTIYHGISIGAGCIFHSGSVVGADGFGFAPSPDGWVKIHQLGGVIIGNKVEIGACTTIDRGALDDTFIDDGVILDNLIQIGHNVRLGKHTAIAANTVIGGSTVIGDNCTIGGAVAIAGHLTIVDKVYITGMSMVTNSVTEAGSYSSGVPLAPTKEWRKNAARFRNLDNLATRLIKLERTSPKDE